MSPSYKDLKGKPNNPQDAVRLLKYFYKYILGPKNQAGTSRLLNASLLI
jgi:hypothetical protein